MFKRLQDYIIRPMLYADSTSEFWNDPHISKGMMEAHLNPSLDGATRNHEFVKKSVRWINETLPPEIYPKLLDIGCGPGIYAELFYENNYLVTGIDFSERSLEYAKDNAKRKNMNIEYLYKDYMTLEYENEFDIITLIYCDYAVLSDKSRKLLLQKLFKALRNGGKLLFDVFSTQYYAGCNEKSSWRYNNTGFFCEVPHIELYKFYRYDEDSTVLDQHIIIEENSVNCYNLWKHTFTINELKEDLLKAGFSDIEFYGDIAGAKYQSDSDIICSLATKSRFYNVQ